MNDIFKNKKILIIGDVMLDKYTFVKFKKLSSEAPVAIYDFDKTEFELGGAANVAANIASLGANAILYIPNFFNTNDCVYTNTFFHLLNKFHVDYFKYTQQDATIIVKERFVVKTTQICRIDRDVLYPACLLAPVLSDCSFDAVILSDYDKGTITKELCSVLAKVFNCPIFINGKPQKDGVYGVSGKLTAITYNESEFSQLNILQPDTTYIITKGNKPTVIYKTIKNGDILSTSSFNTYKTIEKDITGAGDTFLAALTLSYVYHKNLSGAVRFGNYVASKKVQKFKTEPVSIKEL